MLLVAVAIYESKSPDDSPGFLLILTNTFVRDWINAKIIHL